jgi:hypothetical protein
MPLQQHPEDHDRKSTHNYFHVTSRRGDNFFINPQTRTLQDVTTAIMSRLPDVHDLIICRGHDQEQVTTENESIVLQSPVIIEYGLSGGGATLSNAITSFTDLSPQVKFSLPAALRIHLEYICALKTSLSLTPPPAVTMGQKGLSSPLVSAPTCACRAVTTPWIALRPRSYSAFVAALCHAASSSRFR